MLALSRPTLAMDASGASRYEKRTALKPAPHDSSPQPRDTLSRPMRDLRVSITDRCNFRCTYCMPREVFGRDYEFLPKGGILTFEEIARLVRIFATLGVEKVRLTGGEPLLRKDVALLVAMLARIPGIRDLTLTTNGSRLPDLAQALRQAGLSRITVSLDALDDATFRRLNDVNFPVERVLAGIDAAVRAGFSPVKINAVIRRGVNEHAIDALAARFSGPQYVLRFIEFMDVGNTNHWRVQEVVPSAEIARRLGLAPVPAQYRGEVAARFRTPLGGEIGLISSVTQPFCRDCTRARLTADGRLFTCLFGAEGRDLRGPLRAGATDDAIEAAVRSIWLARADRYSELRANLPGDLPKVEMSAIGG
jgi:cyclic pyranopterin phosphate synthase